MGPKRGSLPGGCGLGSVLPAHTRSVAPEPFEVVVRALLGAEHMHHDVDVVEEPPPGAGWWLLDYVDVVVHVFGTEERSYYDLERLWRDAPRVSWEDGSEAASAG